MPNANYDDLATTTIELRSKQIADNFSNHTALLFKLKARGNVEPADGGTKIIEELGFAGPGNAQMYSGYDILDISQGDMITAAEYNWKQAAVAVTMSGLEMDVQNTGVSRFIGLFSARQKLAEQELLNLLSDASNGLYSDGTGTGGKAITGIQAAISDAGTGTYGNIDSSTDTWWQNQIFDFSTEGLTASASTMQTAMNTLELRCTVNRYRPDLGVADNTYFNYFWESLQAQQRQMDADLGKAGFRNLVFNGIPITPDGAMNGAAPSAHMYFINTEFMAWRPHPRRNMVPLNPQRHAVNQDAFVKLVGFAGNLTTRGRRYQGAIVA